MAFFKSPEERADVQAQKDLALLQKYGLENLNDPMTIKTVREMVEGMRGFKWFQTGASLSLQGDKAVDMQMKKTLIDQNFIIIRQLDNLTKLLEK